MDDLDLAKRVAARFAAEDPSRERDTGRFMHSHWSRMCKLCGHPVGVHAGEKDQGLRPCFHGDTYEDPCECPVFTTSPRFMSDEDYERYTKGKFTPSELKELRSKGSKTDSQLEQMHNDLYSKFHRK